MPQPAPNSLPSYFQTMLIISEVVITAIVLYTLYRVFKRYKDQDNEAKKENDDRYGRLRRDE